ncbi:MAG: hypothetical protein IT289_11195 [Oligoflexia bacterium]|nr:hypothetical protein [Oligoflexia bacterium]
MKQRIICGGLMTKKIGVIVFGLVMTAAGMSLIYANRMQPRMFCHDPNIGQNGALAASVEMGGLSAHTAINLYSRVVGSPTPLLFKGTYDVKVRRLVGQKGEVFDDFQQGPLSLRVARHQKDPSSGKFLGELKFPNRGKTVSTRVVCQDQG